MQSAVAIHLWIRLFDPQTAQEEEEKFAQTGHGEFPFRARDGSTKFPSPSYNGMVGNIARELISFSDFPFQGPKSTGPVDEGQEEETNLFPSLGETIRYLREYVERHGLRQYISFGTEVVSVRVRKDWKWIIKTRQAGYDDVSIWDAVVVAAGLWDRIHIPSIEGIDKIPRERLVHARFYRSPAFLHGKVMHTSDYSTRFREHMLILQFRNA